MAPRKTGKAVAATSAQDIALIDQQMSAGAQDLAKRLGQTTGNAVKIIGTGMFRTPDGAEHESLDIIILDFTNKNYLYTVPFNEKNILPPDCYAQNDILIEMVPDPEAPSPQDVESCMVCPLNAFKSGQNGSSKACKNTREIAFLIADGGENKPDAVIYTMSLPPTSITNFDGAIKNINRLLNGFPIKAILHLTAESKNNGKYAVVHFEAPEANQNYGLHWSRREAARELLVRKPDFTPREAPARAPARPAARRAGAAPTRTAQRGR